MKLISFIVPMLIVSLTVIAVWGVGMLAVRASAVSTQTSIELLRMHLRVERLHEQLLRHSREAMAAHVASILADGAAAPEGEGTTPPATGLARPWPEEAGPRQAQPALHRLLGRLQQTPVH